MKTLNAILEDAMIQARRQHGVTIRKLELTWRWPFNEDEPHIERLRIDATTFTPPDSGDNT